MRISAVELFSFRLEKSCSEFGLNGRITASTIGLQPYPPPPASHRPESPRLTTPVRLGRWSLLISHFEYRSKTILFQMVFYMWGPRNRFLKTPQIAVATNCFCNGKMAGSAHICLYLVVLPYTHACSKI